MSPKALALVTAGLLGWGLAPAAADTKPEHGFVQHTCRGPDKKEARYYVFVPYDYKGDKPYPLIVFLHGSGETGRDGRRAIAVGLGPAIRRQEKTFPFLAVFPQGRRPSWDADSEAARRALAIVDDVRTHYRVHTRRI